jgi:16S rRNA (guanine527-N7)-methyltransferase
VTISEILKREAPQFKLSLTEAQLEAFEIYGRQLVSWNEQVNLTRIIDPTEIARKHFLDSLSIWPVLPPQPAPLSMIDVGSGAGFPGLPLKLIQPNLRLTLLESTGKKTAFLQHLDQTLQLSQVTILTARAEEAGQQPAHREQYDLAVARAVAPLQILAEYTLPFVKVGGWVILQKGQDPSDEIAAAKNALGILGGKLSEVIPVTIPGLPAQRHLVILRKHKPTPKPYPRRPGLPTKKPI